MLPKLDTDEWKPITSVGLSVTKFERRRSSANGDSVVVLVVELGSLITIGLAVVELDIGFGVVDELVRDLGIIIFTVSSPVEVVGFDVNVVALLSSPLLIETYGTVVVKMFLGVLLLIVVRLTLPRPSIS